MAEEIVAILDAGSQYGKLIDRCVRELNVRTELVPLNTTAVELKARGYKLVVPCLLGSLSACGSDTSTAPQISPIAHPFVRRS